MTVIEGLRGGTCAIQHPGVTFYHAPICSACGRFINFAKPGNDPSRRKPDGFFVFSLRAGRRVKDNLQGDSKMLAKASTSRSPKRPDRFQRFGALFWRFLMPLNLSHNHFGDYTPLSRTPAGFKSLIEGPQKGIRLGQDELRDRPHFGVDEKNPRSSGPILSGRDNAL